MCYVIDTYALIKNVFCLFVNVSSDYVRCAQFSKIVPHPRSLDSKAAIALVRSGTWNSQLTGVCRSKSAAAERWRWLAIRLKVLRGHAMRLTSWYEIHDKIKGQRSRSLNALAAKYHKSVTDAVSNAISFASNAILSERKIHYMYRPIAEISSTPN